MNRIRPGVSRHPPHHVVLEHRAQVVVVDLGEHLRLAHVRVLDEVAGVVDRSDRGAGLLERGQHVVAGALGDPVADVGVEQVGVLGPAAAGGEPRLVDDLGVARPARSTRSAIALGAGGDGDPVSRRRSGRCCAARCWSTGCRDACSTSPVCS